VAGPHILVDDVLNALTKLAKLNRASLDNLKVVAITGSQGKTTAKDLTKHLLEVVGNTIAPKASLNNELGVPLLLLQCNEETKFCIVEMGARHKGDIAHLVEIASPNIGVVLNVGHAHIGEFGSREDIAETKGELIAGLPEGGVAILGNYDPFTPKMAEGMGLKKVIFGESTDCDVRAADVEVREGRANFDLVTAGGRAPVSLQLLGLHQISNALAAASVASELGMGIDSIAAALSTAEPESKWRMELIEQSDITIINDSYNANPESMAAALRTLALLTQERGGVSWAILGKMHELGASEVAEEEKIGKIASDIGIDHLLSIGVKGYLAHLSEGETTGHLVADSTEALKFVEHFSAGDVLLIKASRAEHLDLLTENIISALRSSGVVN
jgi:UDP-N-acetylmuramoyl-tripeptide--D-alanyl-D-alanine ligase